MDNAITKEQALHAIDRLRGSEPAQHLRTIRQFVEQDHDGTGAIHPNHLPDLRYIYRVLATCPQNGDVQAAITGIRYIIARTEEAAEIAHSDDGSPSSFGAEPDHPKLTLPISSIGLGAEGEQ